MYCISLGNINNKTESVASVLGSTPSLATVRVKFQDLFAAAYVVYILVAVMLAVSLKKLDSKQNICQCCLYISSIMYVW